MIKLIIYDLDGTLIDSSKDISNSINWMLNELGFASLPEPLIRNHVGSGVVYLIKNVLNEVSPDFLKQDGILEKATKLYRGRYSDHLLDETKLYPHVPAVLDFFKNRKQAVLTNKTEDFSRRILKGLQVDQFFFDVVGGDRTPSKKPAPDSVLKLIEAAGVRAGETVLIGDSTIDVQTAKNAAVHSVAVTYGFNSRREIELCQPDRILDEFNALIHCDLMK